MSNGSQIANDFYATIEIQSLTIKFVFAEDFMKKYTIRKKLTEALLSFKEEEFQEILDNTEKIIKEYKNIKKMTNK